MSPLAPLLAAAPVLAVSAFAQLDETPSELMQWGSTGLLALAFMAIVGALVKGQIVSRDTAKLDDDLAELTAQAIEIAAKSLEREARYIAWLDDRPTGRR
tara:strand:+ start:122 stop:421 length:300 start_codon:yes stop_codon:yes gene_type:complete